jgi:hypothetical protein
MDHDVRVLADAQSKLVSLAHQYRQGDKFEVSQEISNAAGALSRAIRLLELSKQSTADTGEEHG